VTGEDRTRAELDAALASDAAWRDFARRDVPRRRPAIRAACLALAVLSVLGVLAAAAATQLGRGSGSPTSHGAAVTWSMPWPHTPCSGRTPAQLDRVLGRPISSGTLPGVPELSSVADVQSGIWLQFKGNAYGGHTWVEWKPARDLVSVAFLTRGVVRVLWTARIAANGYAYDDGGCRGASIQPF
jgi:hypothetical protein